MNQLTSAVLSGEHLPRNHLPTIQELRALAKEPDTFLARLFPTASAKRTQELSARIHRHDLTAISEILELTHRADLAQLRMTRENQLQIRYGELLVARRLYWEQRIQEADRHFTEMLRALEQPCLEKMTAIEKMPSLPPPAREKLMQQISDRYVESASTLINAAAELRKQLCDVTPDRL